MANEENNDVKALKSGVWYTISNFILKSINFITIPIFTRLLTQQEVGQYYNYVSWLNIITIFATLNLESTLASAKYDFREKFDKYILSLLALSTTITSVWFLVLNVLGERVTAFLGVERIHLNSMLVYLLFLPALNLYQSRERYYFEYKRTVAMNLLLTLSTTFLSVLLVITLENSLDGRIIGSVIPTIILGCGCIFFFITKGRGIDFSYWNYALKICLPYIPHMLSLTVLNSVDRVMIEKMCGSVETALYSLAYSCGSIITIFLTSINSAFAPWLGEKIVEKKYSEIRHFSKVYIILFMIIAIGIMIVAPEILLIFGGKEYIEAKYVMIPVALGCVCQFLYTMLVNVEQFCKKTVGMAIASVIAAILNYILNLFFIPKYGYIAAAYTTLIGYLALMFMHMLLVEKIRMKEVYSYRFFIVSLGLCCLLALLINYSYSLNWFRFVILGVYVGILIIIAIKNKDMLLKILKSKAKRT